MEKSIVKTTKSSELYSAKSRRIIKMISEEDIRRKAFEIYIRNDFTSHNELDDWLKAERELKGNLS